MATNPRYANGARRRALRQRILSTETHCGICGGEVDMTLKTPHPRSPEIDEIIPVSKGGDPLALNNCRLTHRRCNRARSNKPDSPTTTAGRIYLTPRTW